MTQDEDLARAMARDVAKSADLAQRLIRDLIGQGLDVGAVLAGCHAAVMVEMTEHLGAAFTEGMCLRAAERSRMILALDEATGSADPLFHMHAAGRA